MSELHPTLRQMVVDMNKIKEGMTRMNKHDMFIFTSILGPIILFKTYNNLFNRGVLIAFLCFLRSHSA